MRKPPLALQQDTEQFAQAIRQPSAQASASITHYHQFLYDKIDNVVAQSFPHFSACLPEESKMQLINAFLAIHGAIEPEFHHIATEFVRFTQQYGKLQKTLLTLLEYEWVLFYAEIDPSHVTQSAIQKIPKSGTGRPVTLLPNPTLQSIELPFAIDQAIINFSATTPAFCPIVQGHFFYAIFRNSYNLVLCQSLTLAEKYIIDNIKASEGVRYDTLKNQLASSLPPGYLQQQLAHFNTNNLITIQLIGKTS
ncbi:MAG: hypothetical protein A3J38_03640 [Gammaproteobacteria bacterium RIFCSPHIGHO2_12_FULL_45_9]|nr:MAG: hypothetical protein A3J38_03640 [Gammaproteobacteria bacterium RIFCSPHIGHO2_12_FULL_45_9]